MEIREDRDAALKRLVPWVSEGAGRLREQAARRDEAGHKVLMKRVRTSTCCGRKKRLVQPLLDSQRDETPRPFVKGHPRRRRTTPASETRRKKARRRAEVLSWAAEPSWVSPRVSYL